MDSLTINEAAETTGWSPRMLRYVERIGLVAPQRSGAGYRLYGPPELQRLRTLRELQARFVLGPIHEPYEGANLARISKDEPPRTAAADVQEPLLRSVPTGTD